MMLIKGASDDRFIISVKTDNAGTSANNQFTIPTSGTGFNYTVTTDDGYEATGLTGNHTITFPSGAGEHVVRIEGDFPYIYFNNGGDKLKLLEIQNFGFYTVGTGQRRAFYGCSNLDITATDTGDFSNVTTFRELFRSCSSLTSFPLIDTSSSISFERAWFSCSSLTSVPSLDFSGVGNKDFSFFRTWQNCSSLVDFPPNMFDTVTTGRFSFCFDNTNLSQTSIDNILVSINTANTSNGSFNQSGGSAPSAAGLAAISDLVSRGWTVTYTA